MLYLIQNDRQYDYDVRAIALAFFEREKIQEISDQELPEDLGENRLCRLDFLEGEIQGLMTDAAGRTVTERVHCDYNDHKNCRNDVSRFLYRLFSAYTGRSLPWGMLTGIRPTKIIMGWMEEDQDPDFLEQRFMDTYLTDRQKARLCRTVAFHEKEILESHPFEEEYSLYVGIPFCPTTCLYCSFTSFPVSRFGDRMTDYLSALEKEISYTARACAGRKMSTIYVGGGTPTALDESSLSRLMEILYRNFPLDQVPEFTVEAGRPDSVTREKLRLLKDAGVSRISINPQTMHDETLRLIGRNHTVAQTIEAFSMAREEGFDNINMDMITGLPGEEIEHVYSTLQQIRQLEPESLTVHSLAIKRAANLNIEMERYRSLVKGSTNDMLRLVDRCSREMGMSPYYMYRQKNIPGNLENIGYSLPGRECLYNILIMEEKQDIIACGAGATTKYVFPRENRIERTESVKNLDHYIFRIDEMIDRKRKYLDADSPVRF